MNNMRRFILKMGKKLDVNPIAHGPWCRKRGYVSVWEFRDYNVFGLSDGGGPGGEPDRYFFKA